MPLTWQATIIFRHYFTLVVLHVQLFEFDFSLPPQNRWKLHCSCYYAASSGNFLPMFQENLLVPSSGVKNPKVRIRLTGCPKILVRNYHYSLHNNPEQTVLNCFFSRSSYLTKNTNCADLKNRSSSLSSWHTDDNLSGSIVTTPIQTWHPQLPWQPVSFHLISHMSYP